jgi:hypothetical protein
MKIFTIDNETDNLTMHAAAKEAEAHSVRGFISGTLGKKMGLRVVSARGEDGARRYSVKSLS